MLFIASVQGQKRSRNVLMNLDITYVSQFVDSCPQNPQNAAMVLMPCSILFNGKLLLYFWFFSAEIFKRYIVHSYHTSKEYRDCSAYIFGVSTTSPLFQCRALKHCTWAAAFTIFSWKFSGKNNNLALDDKFRLAFKCTISFSPWLWFRPVGLILSSGWGPRTTNLAPGNAARHS